MIEQTFQTPPERTGGALEGITVIELCGARGHFMGKLFGVRSRVSLFLEEKAAMTL